MELPYYEDPHIDYLGPFIRFKTWYWSVSLKCARCKNEFPLWAFKHRYHISLNKQELSPCLCLKWSGIFKRCHLAVNTPCENTPRPSNICCMKRKPEINAGVVSPGAGTHALLATGLGVFVLKAGWWHLVHTTVGWACSQWHVWIHPVCKVNPIFFSNFRDEKCI